MSEKMIHLNEEAIKGQIKELVRGSVEETLNELLPADLILQRLQSFLRIIVIILLICFQQSM